MTAHPLRCWTWEGHERCAFEHAASRARLQAAHAAGREKLFRDQLTRLEHGLLPDQYALDAAVAVLDGSDWGPR